MNKKRLEKITLRLLLVMYVLLAIVFCVQIFSLSNVYTELEKERIVVVQTELDEILQNTKQADLDAKIDELVKKYPMEVIVNSGNKTVYTTFGSVTVESIRSILHDDAILYKAQTPLNTKQGNYFVIYGIYHVSMVDFIQSEFRYLTIFLFLLIIIIVATVTLLCFILLRPLQKIRAALSNIDEYKYGDLIQDDNAVAADLNRFKQNVDSKLINVSHNYSDLEIALQFERERLSIMMTLARAYIHELKSPVHQILLENDFVIEKIDKKNKEAQTIAKYNVDKTDQLLQQINEILVLMDSNSESLAFAVESFDFIEVCDNTWNLFKQIASQNNIGFFSDMPEQLNLAMNKVTAKILIHNLFSNATKYATPFSEITFEIDDSADDTFTIICSNETTEENIVRMKSSEELFNVIDIEHGHSSGNGLYLLRELSEYVNGTYEFIINDNEIAIKLTLPKLSIGSDDV